MSLWQTIQKNSNLFLIYIFFFFENEQLVTSFVMWRNVRRQKCLYAVAKPSRLFTLTLTLISGKKTFEQFFSLHTLCVHLICTNMYISSLFLQCYLSTNDLQTPNLSFFTYISSSCRNVTNSTNF